MKYSNKIPIGGFHKQSLIDYPGHISAVIFTCGCNFSCNYCHNPQLIDSDLKDASNEIKEETILEWIEKNSKMLDAVVITGGEPTLHSALPDLITKIKQIGIKVKLDTNGSNPEMLKSLIDKKLIDYVAMDIKAPLSLIKYRKVVGSNFNDPLLNKVMNSVEILNTKVVDCEFRTTVDESFSLDDFKAIAGKISGEYFIQNKTENGIVSYKRFSEQDFKTIKTRDLKISVR